MIDDVSRPSTAHDVAKLAGVSQAAVSRSFTTGASISAATRAKVVEAAEALGYRPNLLARSLITGRSKLVGVGVGNLENDFFRVALETLTIRLAQEGRRILLFGRADGRSGDTVRAAPERPAAIQAGYGSASSSRPAPISAC